MMKLVLFFLPLTALCSGLYAHNGVVSSLANKQGLFSFESRTSGSNDLLVERISEYLIISDQEFAQMGCFESAILGRIYELISEGELEQAADELEQELSNSQPCADF